MKSENQPLNDESKAKKERPKHFLAWSVLNRDLQQLEFFRRVLEEATDNTTPPLERLKFLSVFSSNLDEFFMVRVSGIKEMLDVEDIRPMPGELTPHEQLKVGVEMEYKNFTVKDTRGDPENSFVIGPTVSYRTSKSTRLDFSALAGVNDESPAVQVFAVFSWILGPGGEEHGEAPVSTRNR